MISDLDAINTSSATDTTFQSRREAVGEEGRRDHDAQYRCCGGVLLARRGYR